MEDTTTPAPYDSRGTAQAALCAQYTLRPAKQVLATLPPPPPYPSDQGYRDAVSVSAHSATPPACHGSLPEYRRLVATAEVPWQPHPDASQPPIADVDDVPLGHLVSAQAFLELQDSPCGDDEAPPSYATAVGQSQRGTLLQHILRGREGYHQVDDEGQVGMDEEALEEERYAVEKIAAMFSAAMILFIVSVVLGWMVLGSVLR